MSTPSYLIIGSGVFGASTALHLIRTHPTSHITLLDRDPYTAPTRVAASWDWNKIIRADYVSRTYCALALEAQRLWRADPLWAPFYHESGVVWISPTNFASKVRENFRELGEGEGGLKVLSVSEGRGVYKGVFEGADYTGVEEVLVNERSGWAEAKEALQATVEEAVRMGVRYVVGEVERMRFEEGDGGRKVRGVVLGDGTEVDADRVVLCTGAGTPRLLVDSAPGWKELHAGERIVAAAVTEATVVLGEDEVSMLEGMPVGSNDNPIERGWSVGCLPLPQMGALKCYGQYIVRNTLDYPAGTRSESLSTPPMQPDYAQWDVSPLLQDDVRWALRSLLGEKKSHMKMENFRICWEAITPSEDFIISPHPVSDGLFIATCGSFHGYKFLPVLGKYVVQMLEGKLDPSLQTRWAWDREPLPHEGRGERRLPSRELSDLA